MLTIEVAVTDIRMEDPVPTYTYLVDQFKRRYPNAYLHVIASDAPTNVPPKEKSVSRRARWIGGMYLADWVLAIRLHIQAVGPTTGYHDRRL